MHDCAYVQMKRRNLGLQISHYKTHHVSMSEKLSIALNEFIHVGLALTIIIALVAMLTGIIKMYVPQQKLQKRLSSRSRFGPFIGAGLGMLTPFCSASMVPVAMGMAQMGASCGTVLGFLISAPLCNFVVVGVVLAVFGWKLSLVYFAITFGGAVISGYVIGSSPLQSQIKRDGLKTDDDDEPEPVTHKDKLRRALRFAKALFKNIFPYVLAGAAISAACAVFMPDTLVEKYVGGHSAGAIPIAAAIGVPLYLRIEMAIPLLKVLIGKGMGMGPAMALLIGGTGASLPELAIISSVLKPKAVVAFVLSVLFVAIAGGYIFQTIA